MEISKTLGTTPVTSEVAISLVLVTLYCKCKALSHWHLLEWGLVSYDHRCISQLFSGISDRNQIQRNLREIFFLLAHINKTPSIALASGMARFRFSNDDSLSLNSAFFFFFTDGFILKQALPTKGQRC